jgi:hypothetical protein
MHKEMIRSNASRRGQYARHNTVLVRHGTTQDGMRGMLVGRVKLFCSFKHETVAYPTVLVEWFVHSSDAPDPVTGMWVVEPHVSGGERSVGLVHLDTIVRGCQLIGVCRAQRLPAGFSFTYSLDTFKRFYVNRYLDYHSHELL